MGIKPSWDKPSWRVTALALLLLMIALAQCMFLESTPGFCCTCHQPWGRMAKLNPGPLPPASCRLATRDVPGEGLGTAAAAAANQ